ncbi:uncharacterized protein si:dkey-21e13.3 isoform X2 [Epinephelus fuscoguttatus]|uniref:uncharacterized protein si:dkey-21e13.3 isoform X2 n=1 Tax=Epinephelus fuscoguttatus TaxID=293821 RepID=UPI0020D0CEA4|nr:uncharacterized protein si:dkey-21e13.3 isoform X2 [Epinephelus fuscoguttatus]
MGHPNVPLVYTYARSHRDKRRSSRLQPYTPNDNLNNALGAIRVLGLELIADELKPHLNTVLTNIKEKNKGAAEQVVISGILPILALSLRSRGPLTVLTAKLVAELAKESKLQEMLLRRGAVPRLVAILLRFPEKEALEEVCLQALCNLSGMSVAEEAGMVWERGTSVRPGESVFHGISPHTCGFASSVTLVCVSQWAPGQYAVNIEVFQRCSSSFWSLHVNKRSARWFPFSSWGSCSNLYKVMKFSTKNVPRTKSLKTRVFHTFL